jgi:hypothetical protein
MMSFTYVPIDTNLISSAELITLGKNYHQATKDIFNSIIRRDAVNYTPSGLTTEAEELRWKLGIIQVLGYSLPNWRNVIIQSDDEMREYYLECLKIILREE